MKRWYVVTTKAGPFRPARGLREQGIQPYIAKKFTAYRPPADSRRLHAVTSLRFEGYLFVQADAEAGEMGPVSNTAGVGSLVPPYPAAPFPIDDEIIDGLRQAEDEELEAIRAQAASKASPFPLGSTVRIVRGRNRGVDQSGMHGQVAGYSPRNGIVTLFVGSWVVKVPECDVDPVGSQGGK